MTPPPPTNPLLNYQTPAAPQDREQVTWSGPDVRIDLGPVPNTVFVTQITVLSLALVFATVALIALTQGSGGGGAEPRAWVLLPLGVVVSAGAIFWNARHRRVHRVVAVSGGIVAYADPRTAGRLTAAHPGRLRRIVVRRCWWRPWVCQLQADPDVKFWSTKSGTETEPRTLAFDAGRRKLERVATELRRSLGLEPHPNPDPEPPATRER